MMLDPEHVAKPPRKLRKLLKYFSAHPEPEDVHELRTQARRMEAVIDALAIDQHQKIHRLLKIIRKLRRAAGDVRDMDVLIEHATSLGEKIDGDAIVRLVEFISDRRKTQATELNRILSRNRNKTCKRLKRFAKGVSTWAGPDAAPPKAAQTLATELSGWPKLSEGNLHSFRIHAKELRYMLQLAPNSRRLQMEALDKAKDVIGEWHDWMELRNIAIEALDSKLDAGTLKHIQTIEEAKLHEALAVANDIRTRYCRRMSQRNI